VRGVTALELTPPLTATYTPIRKSGELLAATLIDLIEGKRNSPSRTIMPFDLILRGSVQVA